MVRRVEEARGKESEIGNKRKRKRNGRRDGD